MTLPLDALDLAELEDDAEPEAPARRRRGNPERVRQVVVVRWLRGVLPPGWKVAAIVNEAPAAASDPLARARFYEARRRAGVLDGMTDLVVIGAAPAIVWLEMKNAGGELTEAQDDMHRDLRALGWHVGVAVDVPTARWVLRQAGVPLAETPDLPAWPAAVRVAKPAGPRLVAEAMPF